MDGSFQVSDASEQLDSVRSRAWCRITQAAGALALVLAPADCRACGLPLLTAVTCGVCGACLQSVQAEAGVTCARCGERLEAEDASVYSARGSNDRVCRDCEETAPPFQRATAFGAYEGMLRTLIRLHKFEGLQQLAEPLGRALAPILLRAVVSMPAGDVHVVPVPLYRGRRAYNQSALLTASALRHTERHAAEHRLLRSDRALKRTRATQSQSQLSTRQRRENVRGAFAVDGDVRGWHVVLIDDVFTTGETATECTRTLLRAGAAAVHVVTLARAQPDRVALWRPGAATDTEIAIAMR